MLNALSHKDGTIPVLYT